MWVRLRTISFFNKFEMKGNYLYKTFQCPAYGRMTLCGVKYYVRRSSLIFFYLGSEIFNDYIQMRSC